MERLIDLTLDGWLAELAEPTELTLSVAFPNEAVRDAYLDSVPMRSEEEVREMLRRFLMPTGTGATAQYQREYLEHLAATDSATFNRSLKREFNRRVLGIDLRGEPPWQGLTWVLDLLPDWPARAIDVVEAYFLAHMFDLPDWRITGLSDAQALIRVMWIGNPSTVRLKRELLFELGDRRFEHLIESLYHRMGFSTVLTRPSRDGGRDLEIARDRPGQRERSIVECKLWRKPVGVPIVRGLLGVVANEVSTKGVLVAPTTFTRPSREFARDARLELVGWEELVLLLDEHLGSDWPRRVDYFLADSIKRQGLSADALTAER